jgi:hypothetical protein
MSEKTEYESLLRYFKYLVTLTLIILGLIITAGSIVFIQDRHDLKDQLNELKDESIASISRTEDAAFIKVEEIKREIEEIAEKEITKELDYIFEKENISKLIMEKVKNEIKQNVTYLIDNEINKSVKNINEQLTESTAINDAAIRMRIGHIEGLNLLKSYSKNAIFLNNRARANELLIKITNDYVTFNERMSKDLIGYGKDGIVVNLLHLKIENDSSAIMNLVDLINTNLYLNDISSAIVLLNIKAGTNFKPFEIKEINSWYKEK